MVLHMRDKLKAAYAAQRHAAIKRGIDWRFSYAEWLDWWGDDVERRGNHSTGLVMARIMDHGPYEIGNVVKLTQQANRLDVSIIASRKRGYHHLLPYGVTDEQVKASCV